MSNYDTGDHEHRAVFELKSLHDVHDVYADIAGATAYGDGTNDYINISFVRAVLVACSDEPDGAPTDSKLVYRTVSSVTMTPARVKELHDVLGSVLTKYENLEGK
ncbi:hypothetical protein AB7W30_20030 [Providencia manganoxydans]|uniref:hypothetical protein n=1 Tax=Providencia manganoxydans TaxID=2923283 RepID=UPI0032DB6409